VHRVLHNRLACHEEHSNGLPTTHVDIRGSSVDYRLRSLTQPPGRTIERPFHSTVTRSVV
jgi:hypothetical protein